MSNMSQKHISNILFKKKLALGLESLIFKKVILFILI